MVASWFARAAPTAHRDFSTLTQNAAQLPVSSQLTLSVAHTWYMVCAVSNPVGDSDHSQHLLQSNSAKAGHSIKLFAWICATVAVHGPVRPVTSQSSAAAHLSLSASLLIPIANR